jgi:hypothetical protein
MDRMKENSTVVCSICGYDFDPLGHAACTSCPLNNGCHMVCCPSCGSSNIDPAQSTLVRWISKLMGEKKHGVTADLQK